MARHAACRWQTLTIRVRADAMSAQQADEPSSSLTMGARWRKMAQGGGDVLLLSAESFQFPGASPPLLAPVRFPWCSHALDGITPFAGISNLPRHTFACVSLMRYRDPFALMSLLGHTTLQMTNHSCEAVQQLDVVQADTTNNADGIDTKLLEGIAVAALHAGGGSSRRGGRSS